MKTQTTEELKKMERLIRENPIHVAQVMEGLAKIARNLKKKEEEKAHGRPSRETG